MAEETVHTPGNGYRWTVLLLAWLSYMSVYMVRMAVSPLSPFIVRDLRLSLTEVGLPNPTPIFFRAQPDHSLERGYARRTEERSRQRSRANGRLKGWYENSDDFTLYTLMDKWIQEK